MNNRRNRNYNNRHYECGNYDIFVREHRSNYDRHNYRNNDNYYNNNDEYSEGSHFFEIVGLIIGIAMLIACFNM